MTTCLNILNPRGGFLNGHSEFCAYPHFDGEIRIQPLATAHIQSHVSTDRPNGLDCCNVCEHHVHHWRDRDGKEHKRREGSVIITDHPIVDPGTSQFASRGSQCTTSVK